MFIEKNLTLQAAGAQRTMITGAVVVEPHTVVTITGATMEKDDGVFNEGTLTLNSSVVKHSSANCCGGIANEGGTLTLNNSTVTENSARHFSGGGIGNERGGTVTLHNSTVSGNRTPGTRTAESSGGGIYNKSGTVTLSNTKVSGNTAEAKGGGIYNKATLTLNNSTVTGNTAPERAGIFNEPPGEVNLKNSRVQSP